MLSYPKRRWSVAEFERMIDLGFLREGSRWFLWDGRIYEPPPESLPHRYACTELLGLLGDRLSRAEWMIGPGQPLALPGDNRPQPDLVVCRGPSLDFFGRHPGPEDVALVVEVADSSYPWDAGSLLLAYAGAGIREYWIVNINCRRVEVYRNPHLVGTMAIYDRPIVYLLEDEVPLVLSGGPGPPDRVFAAIPVSEILRGS